MREAICIHIGQGGVQLHGFDNTRCVFMAFLLVCHIFHLRSALLANLKDRKCLLGAFLPGARDSARWTDAIRDLIATEHPVQFASQETEGI